MGGMVRNGLVGSIVVAAIVGLALPRGVVGQPLDSDIQAMKSRNLAFDLNVDADQKTAIHSIELYVSRENSGVWELGATATPDAKSIPYVAKDDGLYLVNMVIVYKSGVRDPADVTKSAPLQKLLIDTTPPVLKITTAEKTGDTVRVAWSVDDRYPADTRTKLEWKPLNETELLWKSVPITHADRRSATFTTHETGGISVRVTVEDLAGNSVVQSKDLPGNTNTGNTNTGTISAFKPASGSSPLPAPDLKMPGGLASDTTSGANNGATSGAASGDTGIVLPTIAPAAATTKSTMPAPPVVDLTKTALPSITPPSTMPSTPPSMPAPLGNAPLTAGGGSSATGIPIASTTAPLPAAAGPDLPSVTAINYLKFDLPYQLEAGPSGISKIELYVTRDDGKTWNKWSVHDGEQRPLRVALDVRGNVQPEGVYGFRLVPISGAGISEHPPTEGSVPDFRVLVDLTPPTIKLFAPDADPAQPGTLTLKWKIEDKNPIKESVAIAWSESQAGPWKSIGGEPGSAIVAGAGSESPIRLADTGSFAWKLPEKVPAKVYLRVMAWDAAGNKSEVTTPNPVLVDLTKPRARIQGIVPASGVVRP